MGGGGGGRWDVEVVDVVEGGSWEVDVVKGGSWEVKEVEGGGRSKGSVSARVSGRRLRLAAPSSS